MEKEDLLKLLKDRDVALGIAEALASVPEAAAALFKAAGPEAAAELLRKIAESPEAARAFIQLLSRPEVAEAVASTPAAVRAFAEAAGRDPEAAARLAAAVAPHLAVPLNVATKEDLRSLATKEDVKALEAAVRELKASMVTKEEARSFATKEDVGAPADRMAAVEGAVKALEGRVAAVEKAVDGLAGEVRGMRIDMRSMQKGLGIRFEHYTAAWVERWLEERGVLCDVKVGERLKVDGLTEVNLLCEDPLVVGKATAVLNTVEEAEQELEKLVERAQAASARLGRPLYAAVLAVEWAPPEVAARLEEACRQKGVVLVVERPPR